MAQKNRDDARDGTTSTRNKSAEKKSKEKKKNADLGIMRDAPNVVDCEQPHFGRHDLRDIDWFPISSELARRPVLSDSSLPDLFRCEP